MSAFLTLPRKNQYSIKFSGLQEFDFDLTRWYEPGRMTLDYLGEKKLPPEDIQR
jgi:hypothetical protein